MGGEKTCPARLQPLHGRGVADIHGVWRWRVGGLVGRRGNRRSSGWAAAGRRRDRFDHCGNVRRHHWDRRRVDRPGGGILSRGRRLYRINLPFDRSGGVVHVAFEGGEPFCEAIAVLIEAANCTGELPRRRFGIELVPEAAAWSASSSPRRPLAACLGGVLRRASCFSSRVFPRESMVKIADSICFTLYWRQRCEFRHSLRPPQHAL